MSTGWAFRTRRNILPLGRQVKFRNYHFSCPKRNSVAPDIGFIFIRQLAFFSFFENLLDIESTGIGRCN